jgi:hypothetical protein
LLAQLLQPELACHHVPLSRQQQLAQPSLHVVQRPVDESPVDLAGALSAQLHRDQVGVVVVAGGGSGV